MKVPCVRMKSSAVSVWIFPGLAGRESVAIFPSGSPVEKEKEAAEAWDGTRSKALKVEAKASTVWAAFVLTKQGFSEVGVLRWRW